MRNPADFLVSPTTKLREAMLAIDRYGLRIVFVVDQNGELVGSLSDGDVRRFLLRGGTLEAEVREAMNGEPKSASIRASAEEWREKLEKHSFTALPLVDGKRIRRIYYRHPVHEEPADSLDLPVVIQAGGKGTRLKPYTDVLPKPLIPVAGKTITEHIMDRCIREGCSRFEMIINYRKEFIRAYFNDPENPYDVHFIEEETFAGTAGGLRLVLPHVDERFFLHNCDVLLDMSFRDFLEFHEKGGFVLSMVGCEMSIDLPYGTIESDKSGVLTHLREKPSVPFVANTGLYLVERRFMDYLGEDEFIHITEGIERAMAQGEKIGVYEVSEGAWLDMGQPEGLAKMTEILERQR